MPKEERPAVFIGAYDEATEGAFHSVIRGPHAEDMARAAMPNAKFTEPMGWRVVKPNPEPQWVEIEVCPVCQPKYPEWLFPKGTPGAKGGAWGR